MEFDSTEALVRTPRNLALAAQGVLTPILFIPCGLMLIIAETWQSRLISAAFILLWSALGFVWLLFFKRTRGFALAALLVTAIGGIAALLSAVAMRPAGIPEGNNLSQHFSGEARFEPMAISNLVPEVDQLSFGTYIVPGNDPFIDATEAAHLRGLVQRIYRELNADEGFRNAGSVLGFCYEDVLYSKRERLHFYQYVPRHLNKPSYPVLIFLHGSLGNFLGYTWVLKRFADETGTMIIAPTYGAGNWEYDRDCSVVREVLHYCEREPTCDRSRVFLGGISNGGTGISRVIAQVDYKWAGAIWISPVIEEEVITEARFKERANQLPMLLLHGEDDDRVPCDLIKRLAATMQSNGSDVEARYFPKEDHFLLFSQPDHTTRLISAWIKEHPP